MKDIVKEKPNIRANKEDLKEMKSKDSPLRARFADDSGVNDEELDQRMASKHILRQTSSNTSNNSVMSPKKPNLRNQKSNNTIPSSVEFKTSTIRQHYYPEGGWGWVVVVSVMFTYIITFGLQLSFAVFLFHLIRQPFGREKYMSGIWLGSLSLGLSYFVSPILVSWCRRKSARLTAIAGGLMASLGCLFASFGSQFHQIVLSYGIFMSLGIGIARESANLMVGQYFKRKRYFVEIFVQSSVGIGIAIMAPFLNWSIGAFKHWRAGLQLITCALFATFLIGVLYRPASLYHPQRRAILHLKTQRRKIREKNPQTNKPPFFDLLPLKTKSLQVILISTFLFSFGHLSPIFYLTNIVQVFNQTVDFNQTLPNVSTMRAFVSTPVLSLHIIFGISLTIGVLLFGCLTVNRHFKYRINKLYLCQISMLFTVLVIISSIYLTEFNKYIVFVIIYGIAIGAFNYSNKILVFSLMRAKNFGKSWSFVQFVQSFAIFVGIPTTGYINNWFSESTYNYGFLFSALTCLSGTLFMLVLNPEFKNMSDKLHEFHSHSCNMSSDTQHLNAMTPINAAINYSDSGVQFQTEANTCCNCGQRLLSSDDNEPFKEYQSIKAEELRSPTLKTVPLQESDDEEEDEDFVNLKLQAQDLEPFFSDDLYNYYLQNGGNEEAMALFDPKVDKLIDDNGIDCLNSRKHLICDSIDDKLSKPLRRTIDTVTEETSSLN